MNGEKWLGEQTRKLNRAAERRKKESRRVKTQRGKDELRKPRGSNGAKEKRISEPRNNATDNDWK